MSLLGIFSIFSTAARAVKESLEPTIPAENWANKELYHQDLMNGVSVEQRMKWVEQGKYKLPKSETSHTEPHRDTKTGQIIIENNLLYKEDLKEYGAAQTYTWVKQGKYNLTPEELEQEHRRLDEKWKKICDIASPDKKKEIEKKQLEEQQKENLYERAKNYYGKLEEYDQITKTSEYLIEQQEEQVMFTKHNGLINDCQKILLDSDYTDINISFSLEKPGYVEKNYGYSLASIVARKHGESFFAKFNSTGRLSVEDGQKLLKSLSTILASVDIADFDNREFNLKELFKIEGLKLQENHQEFEILNDELSIVVDYSNPCHKILLKFYTSKVNLKHTKFDTMDGHQFEHFCANVLRQNGFKNVSVTSGSGDQGVDIIAYKDDIKYGIQCKCYHSDIGNKAVQEVFSGKAFYNCHIGIVLTNRDFTKSAIELAKNNGIILWNRKKLLQMIDNCKDKI